MSSHFLFHSTATETVPFNARYSFPTQASRVIQSQVKIPPRTGTQMGNISTPLTASSKGRTIQITFPAQGYLNPLESYLRFDLGLTSSGADITGMMAPRPLNSIHTMFRRMRILYGSLVLEDIQNYGGLVRMITNNAVESDYMNTAGAILEGMGSDAMRGGLHTPIARGMNLGNVLGNTSVTGASPYTVGPLAYNSGTWVDSAVNNTANDASKHSVPMPGQAAILNNAAWTVGQGGSPNVVQHTYCINLMSGLLTQQKLIPLKWMANQLTIELEIEEPSMFLVQGYTSECPTTAKQGTAIATTGPALSHEPVPANYQTPSVPVNAEKLSYWLDNIYYVAEILEFDSTYDAAFYRGMLESGVPLKFASWHTHQHILGKSNQAVLNVQERARSVKSAFTVIRDRADQNPALFDTDPYWTYPGANLLTNGSAAGTAWTEGYALDEYQFRIGGRYFPSQPVKCKNGGAEPLMELQKALNILGNYSVGTSGNVVNWFRPRGTFTIAAEFESSNGMEMSGINAEELADLSLVLKLSSGAAFTDTQFSITYIHYDAMIILRPNNVLELVQ